jgi:hypothetical protein
VRAEVLVATTIPPSGIVMGFVQMKRPRARRSAPRGYHRRYNENKIRASAGITPNLLIGLDDSRRVKIAKNIRNFEGGRRTRTSVLPALAPNLAALSISCKTAGGSLFWLGSSSEMAASRVRAGLQRLMG